MNIVKCPRCLFFVNGDGRYCSICGAPLSQNSDHLDPADFQMSVDPLFPVPDPDRIPTPLAGIPVRWEDPGYDGGIPPLMGDIIPPMPAEKRYHTIVSCPSCGLLLDEERRICPRCGHKQF